MKGSPNGIELKEMEWGFIPEETKWPFLKSRQELADWRLMFTSLNATCEGLFINEKGKSSIYAGAAQYRRCLVPSTGYWEWRHVKQIGKSGKILKEPAKIPYHLVVTDHQVDNPFYMAGICGTWISEESGEKVENFTIVTTVANEISAQVHNVKKRMPTILKGDLAYEWVFGNLSKDDIMDIAKIKYPTEEMDAWTVAKGFRSALNPRGKFDYAGLPPLGSDEPFNPYQTLSLF
ncbi:SOS response-associated peptidase family protein [Chitinophagaceae bacterium 26-R-25]|nr:SOS response-associated peptidase family protein [Chitinophagaceae bacterium 26-R-25]